MLRKLLTKKVGHISDKLWHETLYEAQHDIRAYKQMCQWKFDSWSRNRKLVYIVNVMARYIRMVCKFDLVEEGK